MTKQSKQKKLTVVCLWWIRQVSSHQASFAGGSVTSAASQAQCTLYLSLQLPIFIYTTVGQASKNKQNEVLASKNLWDTARQRVELKPCCEDVLALSLLLSGQCWMQASLKSQLPTWWECVKFGESLRADSTRGFKRDCIYRCVLTHHWESLIITHSAHTSVKMLILFLDFQRCGNQDSLCTILIAFSFFKALKNNLLSF